MQPRGSISSFFIVTLVSESCACFQLAVATVYCRWDQCCLFSGAITTTFLSKQFGFFNDLATLVKALIFPSLFVTVSYIWSLECFLALNQNKVVICWKTVRGNLLFVVTYECGMCKKGGWNGEQHSSPCRKAVFLHGWCSVHLLTLKHSVIRKSSCSFAGRVVLLKWLVRLHWTLIS